MPMKPPGIGPDVFKKEWARLGKTGPEGRGSAAPREGMRRIFCLGKAGDNKEGNLVDHKSQYRK